MTFSFYPMREDIADQLTREQLQAAYDSDAQQADYDVAMNEAAQWYNHLLATGETNNA